MSKRVGQWLLWIGIASQVLPLLGMEETVSQLLGYSHAQISLLISLLGGFLSGFSSARSLPAPVKATGAASHDTTNSHPLPTPPPELVPATQNRAPAKERMGLNRRSNKSRAAPEQAKATGSHDTTKPKSASRYAPRPARTKPVARPSAPVNMDAHQDTQGTVKATLRQSAPPPAKAEPATRRPAPVKKKTTHEKTPLRIVLLGTGPHRIQVIREVQDRTGLGLKEAIGLVDGTPATIKENVPAREARELKARLEALGATVELL